MEKRIPKKTYRNIMNSLGGGTVPREGLGYIAVGREKEIDSLLRDTEIIQDGGATFRFVVGDYGSGKTFLLQTIKEYCVKNNFIVAEADLSPDRALIGNSAKKKGLAIYRELMANVSNKTNQSGRALAKVLESWGNNMFARAAIQMAQNPFGETNIERIAETLMLEDCAKLQSLAYGYEFTMGLHLFWKASRTSDISEKMTGQENVLRWFRGEFKTNQEAKRNWASMQQCRMKTGLIISFCGHSFLSLRDIRDLLFSSMSLLIFVIQQMVSLARITMKKS